MGLGNPGPEYERTRHNVGWWVVDHLAGVWRFEGWKKDGQSRIASGVVNGQRVRLVKPLTYMNLSGGVLRPYLRREAWDKSRDLLVVVDEVALPIGSFRVRARGSAGGHNGLKSIEATLGSQEYARLRIGVGPEDPSRRHSDLSDYVLGDFGKREAKIVQELLPSVAELIETWLKAGAEVAMNKFNRQGKAGAAE
jgi:PTH1 family peptidyl-tRNA hydrolase